MRPVKNDKFVWNVGPTTYLGAAALIGGTVAIAANSLAVNAEGLCYMAGYGIQSAAVTRFGQAVGANRMDMAKRFAWLCTGLGMGVMALSGVGLWIFAPTLMSLFTTDAAVIALGAQVLRLFCAEHIQYVVHPADAGVPAGSPAGPDGRLGCHVLRTEHPGPAVPHPPCPGQVAGKGRAVLNQLDKSKKERTLSRPFFFCSVTHFRPCRMGESGL